MFASIRKRKNRVEHIVTNNKKIEDQTELKREATTYFKKIFSEECFLRPTIQNLDFKTLSMEQGDFLTAEFSGSELDAVVASCDSS